MASIAFSFSNSMASVRSESDPEIWESAGSSAAYRPFREGPASFAIANRKFTIRNRIARVAKLADASDLGSVEIPR